MILNKVGEYFDCDDVRYTVGEGIVANKNSDYDGVTGVITEITDEEGDVDIFCDLEIPTDPQVIEKIIKRFSFIFGEPQTLSDIPFHGVVLSPDEIN